MSMQDDTPFSLCRIVGLTSEVGKKRNGTAARVMTSKTIKVKGSNDVRHPVSVDGFPGPMSIQRNNIEIFSQEQIEYSVGVGRGTLNDTSFQSTLVMDQSQVAEVSFVEGGAARSRGNLAAMEKFVKRRLQTAKGPILIKLTDLNMVRALNRAVYTGRIGDNDNNNRDDVSSSTVKIAAPLNNQFQMIQKKLVKSKKEILIKYDPHRVHEDRFEPKNERLGLQRWHACQIGSYQIYPCAVKDYLDAHEVRYMDLSPDRTNKTLTIHHEIYLEYGVEEATMYAKHAAALGETDRLSPEVLSQVDPQAFWSAVLWLQPFIATLQQLNLNDLVDQWKALEPGKAKSKEYLGQSMSAFGFELSALKGPEDNWGITSKSQDVHLRIATDYAIGAIQAVQNSMNDNFRPNDISYDSHVQIHTLHYYIGTDLDKYITGINLFYDMAREQGVDYNTEVDEVGRLVDKAMKSAGFARDSKFRVADPEKTCDNCGKQSKKQLMTCARCEGVSYCNVKCQKEHWKQHRGNCSRVFVQLQKQMEKLNIRDGPKLTSGLYEGGGLLPPGPSMISEVSGTGMLSIFWNPDGESGICILDNSVLSGGGANFNASLDETQAIANPEAMMKKARPFTTFLDMHPAQRFLICCGPLPHLETVQQCCAEVLRHCEEGHIGELRVPQLGFTALEWAAKKGNLEIVQWLCTDTRTKAVMEYGCPIGWAGYTGRVEIMRYLVSKGVDHARTDAILWSNQPPLFVAASNGRFEACKFYVEECNENIHMKDRYGNDILKCIKSAPNWRELPGHVDCHKWAKKLLKK